MMRSLAVLVIVCAVIADARSALAITTQKKMEICKFGADDQKLSGSARKRFISKCMANADAPSPRAKAQ
jgi:hypothetical protein